MKKRFLCFVIVVCMFIIVRADGADPLALTPPMGWNSWNCFSCDVNERQIRDMADLIVANGMKDAGYTYVNVDDCWQVDRDVDGNIVVNSVRFPSGIKALADYIHSKGLKFGIYSCADLYPYAGLGHWNDPDMLQVGNGVLTPEENRSYFTMWCLLAAPLLAGNDLRT